MFIPAQSSLENHTQNLCLFSDQNISKTIPFIGWLIPTPPPPLKLYVRKNEKELSSTLHTSLDTEN